MNNLQRIQGFILFHTMCLGKRYNAVASYYKGKKTKNKQILKICANITVSCFLVINQEMHMESCGECTQKY